eukprot:COSAG02_NODE_5167_length_4576_cov_8.229171_2_plen_153_part_00
MWFTGRLRSELPAADMLEALASLVGPADVQAGESLLSAAERDDLDTRGFTSIGSALTDAECEEMKRRLAVQVDHEGPMAGAELLEKQIENLVKQGADRKQVLSQENGVDTLCDLLNKRRLNNDGLFDKCLTHPKCDSKPCPLHAVDGVCNLS